MEIISTPLIDHPNAHLLKKESVAALQEAIDRPNEWVVWQSGLPHAKASKNQAYRLRTGQRQKLLTLPYADRLEFRAYRDEDGIHNVIVRYTPEEELKTA